MTTDLTAADFAAARFAQHPDLNLLAHRLSWENPYPWVIDGVHLSTDQDMAENGWRILTPAPDLSDPDVIDQAAQRAWKASHSSVPAVSWEDKADGEREVWRKIARAALSALTLARDIATAARQENHR